MDPSAEIREQARNRLLRRVDWRFLLPDPAPARIARLAGGPLGEAVGLLSGSVIDPRENPSPDCDLAVAADPDAATLRRAWDCLREGGSCYAEWRRPLLGGSRLIRRRLEATGFREVRCYWPWPSLQRCRAWLPLDAPGALSYFRDWRRPADGVLDRLRGAVRQAQARLKLQLGLTTPLCAVAWKPTVGQTAPEAAGGREPWLFQQVRAAAADPATGRTTDSLSCLLLTGGPRSISKVVGLVFAEPAGRPRVAVKLARVPESNAGLAREAAVLRRLDSKPPGSTPGVPRTLFAREHAGILAVGETAMMGQPLMNLLRRGNYPDWALRATSWLIRLARDSRTPASTPAWDRLIQPVLVGFGESFGPVIDPAMLRATGDALADMAALPVVCEQRDFSPWNVLVTPDNQMVVLDWESAEPEGLPALDAIYFLSYLTFLLDRATRSGRFRESYRTARDPSTLTGGVQRDCLALYAAEMGLDPAVLQPLRLFTWLLHSRSEYDRMLADQGGAPPPERLRRSLFLNLWEEELRWGRP